jgi:hypothetical protein
MTYSIVKHILVIVVFQCVIFGVFVCSRLELQHFKNYWKMQVDAASFNNSELVKMHGTVEKGGQ